MNYFQIYYIMEKIPIFQGLGPMGNTTTAKLKIQEYPIKQNGDLPYLGNDYYLILFFLPFFF